jgi:alpha-beta hydrolase superfamily lysophospholipase
LDIQNEYVVDPEDAMDLFRDLGTPDKAFIMQPGGFHLMFLEKRGHVGLQESIFFWVTKQ